MVKDVVGKLRRVLQGVIGRKGSEDASEGDEALRDSDRIRWTVTASAEPGPPPNFLARPDETGYVIEVPVYVTNIG